MTDLITVNYDRDQPLISARELHKALHIRTKFTTWFERMCEYGFTEGVEFFPKLGKSLNSNDGRPSVDHLITMDMAKHLCMIQRNEYGKMFRDYFIQVERDWNSPDKLIARALKVATDQLKEQKPKVEYYNRYMSLDGLTTFRETSKLLGVPERVFIRYLEEHGYIYYCNDHILPYANNPYLVLREYPDPRHNVTRVKTFVNASGRQHFSHIFD